MRRFQISLIFFCLILVKFLNYLILYADMRQGQNYKPIRADACFSSNKASNTSSTSKKNLQFLSFNSFPKSQIKNPYLVIIDLSIKSNEL